MLVKIASGPRKDQVQDLPPMVAKLMLADGRAVLAFPDQYPAPAELVPVLAPRGDNKPPVKAKRGRHANN